MKDMISQIIEMDKKAREITEQVQNSKLDLEQEVTALRTKIREEYLARARKRLKINQETEQKDADKKWKEIQATHLKISQRLDKTYDDNCKQWVDTIVDRVIGV